MDVNHAMLAKRFEEEVNFQLKDVLEKQPTKKRPNVSNSEVLELFGAKDIFKKDFVQRKQVLQDLALLVVRNHLPILFV